MPTVRFRQHTTAPVRRPVRAPVRQTEALPPMIAPPVPPMLPLPPGYTEAVTATQRYSRSYTRLSRSMRNTYGPIPREIPPEYLRYLAPARPEASHGTIITDDDEPTTSQESPVAPPAKLDSSASKTIVTAFCLLVALVLLGSWTGTMFVSSTLPRTDASQAITRVDQLDPGQYDSSAQYNVWADSTCSAAAMTAVMNAYGHSYRLADILKVEADRGQITPQLGLLYGESSVARTVASFGFTARTLDNTSLDGVLEAANSGTPVIVGFMDRVDFPTGHILVVRGGSGNTVNLVDSSKLNMQHMSRATFMHYYDGFAVLVTPINAAPSAAVSAPAAGYSVLGQPSINADMINRVLSYYHSPAAGQGQALYDLGVKYGIDPAYPLAFFMNESTFGTQGMATITLALSNERCISDRPCVNTEGLPCQAGQSCYAQMYSWQDGFEHWYQLIKNEYVTGQINQVIGRNACPCTTIPQIIPVYAPNSDNNNETHYIWVVEHAVDTWRAGKVVVA